MKKFSALVVSLALVAGLVGCGGPEQPVKESSANWEKVSSEVEESSVEESVAETEQPETEKESGVVQLHPIRQQIHYSGIQENNWTTIAEQQSSTFLLSEEDAAKYPKLQRALKKRGDDTESTGRYSFLESYGYAQEFFVDMADYYEPSDMYNMRFVDETIEHVVRSDSTAFSIYGFYYGYQGGAHGYYSYSGTNYDSQTGLELRVNDVVTDIDRLNEILYDKLMDEYGEDCDLDSEVVKDWLSQLAIDPSAYSWLLQHEQVTFYFNPYCLTSYAGGAQIVNVRFDEAPEIFNPKYTEVPESYCIFIGGDQSISVDLDGDGKADRFGASSHGYDDYETNEYKFTTYVYVNDESVEFESDEIYEEDLYLVKYGDAYYLYAFCDPIYEGGGFIEYYSLKDGKIKKMDEYTVGWLPYLGGNEYESLDGSGNTSSWSEYETCFTDPCNIELSDSIWALSTLSSLKKYHVGANGVLVCDSTYANVSGEWRKYGNTGETYSFITKQDLTMDLLNEDLTVKEKGITIPDGTILWYIRTDEGTYADFRLEDGSEVRAVISVNDWPQTISGVDIEEALDGVMFAG